MYLLKNNNINIHNYMSVILHEMNKNKINNCIQYGNPFIILM